MTTEKRDLVADLEAAEAIASIFYFQPGSIAACVVEGWPAAIRRAIAAEATLEKLRIISAALEVSRAGEWQLSFEYTNHRGEFARRHVQPLSLTHDEDDLHPGPQWLLWGRDQDRNGDTRTFAVEKMTRVSLKAERTIHAIDTNAEEGGE